MKQVLVRGGGVVVDEVPAPGSGRAALLVRVALRRASASAPSWRASQMSGLPLYRRALKQPHHAKRALEVAPRPGARPHRTSASRAARGRDCRSATPPPASSSRLGDGGRRLRRRRPRRVRGRRDREPRRGDRGAGEPRRARARRRSTLDDASTVTLGAIALQGVRRAEPTLGETVVVIGLGDPRPADGAAPARSTAAA